VLNFALLFLYSGFQPGAISPTRGGIFNSWKEICPMEELGKKIRIVGFYFSASARSAFSSNGNVFLYF